jgi:hypothetical protein
MISTKFHLSKHDASEIFTLALQKRANYAGEISPDFEIETWYAEFFLVYLSELPVDDNTNIVPFANDIFNNNLNFSYRKICKVLDKYPVDGTKIFELISSEKPILRKDRTAYNRQVPGKYPKGLKKKEWEMYNNCLLAHAYWQGVLWSLQPDFHIILPDDTRGPIEFFLANEIKPFWGMRMKAEEAGFGVV